MSARFERAVVVGTGLIGASIAVAARRAGIVRHVVGVGRNRANLDVALKQGRVDAIAEDPIAAVTDANLVIVATPVDAALELLPGLAAAAPPNALFTDVGSVKAAIVGAAERAGIGARFVGGHPIAGGTATGAGAADPALFSGRTVVLTSSADTTQATLEAVRALWIALGAIVVEMSASEHDRCLALTSHLPQLAVFALASSFERSVEATGVPLSLVGTGFRDTTRLAASDHDMWSAIVRLNRAEALAAMDAFAANWARLRSAVEQGDEAELRALMGEARRMRERLDR
jgi:prephenate dehydrogenase